MITFCVLQANAQSSCENAAPFCAGGVSGGVFPATTGTTSGQIGPNYNCNGLIASPISWYVPSPAWYYLQVGASGSLDILIQGQQGIPPNTSPGGDVDFVCWGPFSSLSGICNSLTANRKSLLNPIVSITLRQAQYNLCSYYIPMLQFGGSCHHGQLLVI